MHRHSVNCFQRVKSSLLVVMALLVGTLASANSAAADSVARKWNEQLLDAIRHDFARPTMHARNLFHVSIAMYDAWAVYGADAFPYLTNELHTALNVASARDQAISFAAYRLLRWRFADSPGADGTLPALDNLMDTLGYDRNNTSTVGNTPAEIGNRIAQTMIDFGLADGSNEAGDFENLVYEPVNEALVPSLPGNPSLTAPNRWQPLSLKYYIDQGGNVVPFGYPDALSPEWGIVSAFALRNEDRTIYQRDGFDWWVFHDPGPPPMLGTETEDLYKSTFEVVVNYSSKLDPTDGVMIDISPASRGDNTLGTNDGDGYDENPFTGEPYVPQSVPAGDYYRILAEFWADGPASETPPGHWFTIANYVSDYSGFEKRFAGGGPVLDDLEWDVKLYFALGATVHDVAVSAWGAKGWYDYIRPISALRYMTDLGQCTDDQAASYHKQGINLSPGVIELVTNETIQPGERHEHLADGLGKIAFKSWRGPDYINDPATDFAGVDWILAGNWWPYQRPTFVTPPFPGYVSGHSTFSRAAAELMTRITGSEYFPGGLGEFYCPQNEFLVFEEGPTVDVTLQWAKYYDASDECSLSRIYGGIHPPADDIPGRLMGSLMGGDAFELARQYYAGAVHSMFYECFTGPNAGGVLGACTRADRDDDGDVDLADFAMMMNQAG